MSRFKPNWLRSLVPHDCGRVCYTANEKACLMTRRARTFLETSVKRSFYLKIDPVTSTLLYYNSMTSAINMPIYAKLESKANVSVI